MDQHELHYRATLLFGTLDIPDGMRAMGLLSDEAYDHQVEGVILATRNDFGHWQGLFAI